MLKWLSLTAKLQIAAGSVTKTPGVSIFSRDGLSGGCGGHMTLPLTNYCLGPSPCRAKVWRRRKHPCEDGPPFTDYCPLTWPVVAFVRRRLTDYFPQILSLNAPRAFFLRADLQYIRPVNGKETTVSLTENRAPCQPLLAASPPVIFRPPILHYSSVPSPYGSRLLKVNPTKSKFRILITAYGLPITPPPRPMPRAKSKQIQANQTASNRFKPLEWPRSTYL